MNNHKEILLRGIDKCTDMADVCQLAHELTVCDCNELKIDIDQGDDYEENDDVTYTPEAQKIFDNYYNLIIDRTGL